MTAPVTSPISWFEIPTSDLSRATRFYESVLGASLRPSGDDGYPMSVFPYTVGYTGGALVADPNRKPSASDHRIYFSVDHAPGGLDGALARAAASGGKVVLPRTGIGPNGFIGIVADSEGNVVGLHAHPGA